MRKLLTLLTPHVRAIGRPAGPAQDESFVFLLEELTR